MSWSAPARRRIDGPGGRWVITGASRGLGAELATLVERELGAEVIGIDRNGPPEGVDRRHHQIDLSTRAGALEAVELLREVRPTVLVNNASTNQSVHVADTEQSMVDEIIGVGFTTPYLLMQEMARLHRAHQDDTWVVNIVSPYRTVGVRTHSLYCATKAALGRAGESMAVEVALEGSMTVVSVVPGAFSSGFRPVEAHDAWLVRTYRGVRSRSAAPVAAELLRRLRRGSRLPHRTIRLGWDGVAFELITRVLGSDLFLVALDRLIGQHPAEVERGASS